MYTHWNILYICMYLYIFNTTFIICDIAFVSLDLDYFDYITIFNSIWFSGRVTTSFSLYLNVIPPCIYAFFLSIIY